MPTGPHGDARTPAIAPDGQAFPAPLQPYSWSQADRERGAFRRPQDGRSYETVVPVANADGTALLSRTDELLTELIAEVRGLKLMLADLGTTLD